MTTLVVKFNNIYWTNQRVSGIPDGSTIAEGLLDSVRIKSQSVDLRRANTSVGGYDFNVVDKDGELTALLLDNSKYFLNDRVEAWVGIDTSEFSEMDALPIVFVTNIRHDNIKYSFSCSDALILLAGSMTGISRNLTSDLTEQGVHILVPDVDVFPSSGVVKINDEFILFEKPPNSPDLVVITRAYSGGEAEDHERGSQVQLITLASGNPVNVLLELMISGSEDTSEFNRHVHGLELSSDFIDMASFDSIRENHFSERFVEILVEDQGDGLKFLQSEFLQLLNCRFVQKNGTVSLVLLDEAEDDRDVLIDDDIITKYSGTDVRFSDVVNRIKINYGYEFGSGEFLRTVLFEDEDSIDNFGPAKEIEYSFQGIPDSSDGRIFVESIAQRYLQRFSTPTPSIEIQANLRAATLTAGEAIQVISEIIPSQRGVLGLSQVLEVLKVGVNLKAGTVNLSLVFTRFTGTHIARLSPSPTILSSQNGVYSLDDARLLRAGWVMKGPGGNLVIRTVNPVSKQITFTTSPEIPDNFVLEFADLPDVVDSQRRFAFLDDGSLLS